MALFSLPAIVAIWRYVPAGPPESAHTSARQEIRVLREPRLLVTLLLGALVNGATFCTFTYLAPLLTSVTGLDDVWVPALLALFGVGSFVGVTVGGRLADAHPVPLLATGMLALLAGWVAFALTAASPVAAVVLVFVQGTFAFATGSTLISRVFYVASGAPTLAGGLATAAFNVGAAVGPWVGGLALATTLGLRAPLWVSVTLTALAIAVAGAALVVGRARMDASAPRRPSGHPVP